MDHLPSPDHPCYAVPVPYLCKEIYDGLGFEKYPRRAGWDVLKLLDADLGTHSVDELGGFIQTWLYFGILADVFAIIGLDFDQTSFVAQLPSGESVVSSIPLLDHISKWQKKAESLPADERKAQGKRVREVLERASLYTNSILTKNSPPSLSGIADDIITLSILILGSTLFRAASKICIKGLGAHYANNLLGIEEFPDAREDEDDIRTWSEPYVALVLALDPLNRAECIYSSYSFVTSLLDASSKPRQGADAFIDTGASVGCQPLDWCNKAGASGTSRCSKTCSPRTQSTTSHYWTS
jgi:hypothetical protein